MTNVGRTNVICLEIGILQSNGNSYAFSNPYFYTIMVYGDGHQSYYRIILRE